VARRGAIAYSRRVSIDSVRHGFLSYGHVRNHPLKLDKTPTLPAAFDSPLFTSSDQARAKLN